MSERKEKFIDNPNSEDDGYIKFPKNDKNEVIDIILIKKRKSSNKSNPKTKNFTKKFNKQQNHKTRKVKINDKIEIVPIESWKKYNIGLSVDEKFDADILEKEEKNKTNKITKKAHEKIKESESKISCTCCII